MKARLGIAVIAAGLAACTGTVPTGTGRPLFFPSRISVQDLALLPETTTAGAATRIRFKLVRAGDDGEPIYWATHFLETPSAGGTLSAVSGGPVASGDVVEIVYRPAEATTAFVTLYPGSTPGLATGDGSGDWHSFAIEVRPAP
jgi:hypothetical protein